MKIKSLILIALFTLSITSAFAHALWIHTAAAGKKGQAQEVKVFFGEYADKKPDSAAIWFSNLSSFKLMLTSPTGKTQVLDTKADVLNHTATFTPSEDGIYTLSIVHKVADVYSKGRIDYYAFADVTVGKPKKGSNPPSDALLSFNKSKDHAYSLTFNQAAFADKKVEIINPAFEKSEVATSATGELNFKPAAKGGYFLEAMKEEKTTGDLNGQPYEKIWHIATYFTEVI